MPESIDTLIIGAGLAGLACAQHLHRHGVPFQIVEAADAVGGRVRTDKVDGFLLDRGFQVLAEAYPTARRLLDYQALDLRSFLPGAQIFHDGKFRRMLDVWRHPSTLAHAALQPIGSWRDKYLVAKLRHRVCQLSLEDIWSAPELRTEEYLRQFGFSEAMLDGFFRPFYGGVFLENRLESSSRMFEFTFKMFAQGHATLPALGMGEIPRQLAAHLPADSLWLNSPVVSLIGQKVRLQSGKEWSAKHVVVAVDAQHAHQWLPHIPAPAWRSVTTLSFAAPSSPLAGEPILAVQSGRDPLIQGLCVPSDVSPHYAPSGQSLVTVTVLGAPPVGELDARVRRVLTGWFGSVVADWDLLRCQTIRHALPVYRVGQTKPAHSGNADSDRIVCGDYFGNASIDGALQSGLAAAEKILQVKAK